ncbi:hypothetical protein EI94DRAFT_1706191 [Lactarius quietus]|nr:hypothetical protein EI94DRAFT_1706191 [Lactarius quietus]
MSVQQEHTIGSPPGISHRPPSAPPPYSYPPTPLNETSAQTESHQPPPHDFTTVLHGPSKSPRRPLPPLPEPRIDSNRLVSAEPLASGSRSQLRVSISSPSSPLKPSSTAFNPFSSTPSLPPSPPLDTPIPSGPLSARPHKHRSFMPLLSLLRSSKSRSSAKSIAPPEAHTRANDTWLQAEEARRAAELERGKRVAAEADARLAATQSDAREAIKSNIRSLLSRRVPSDEYQPIIKQCAQICESGDLDLSTVLQEPLIDGKPPVYWAILNGPSVQGGDPDFDALVVALVGACEPLQATTITSIRLACMLTSNNVLLQHLFRHFPALSPLSPGDTILLSSVGGGDVVEVDETQDGTGTFVARIQVRRFRLRMRVSKLIKIEFVTSDRVWTVMFSISPANAAQGLSDNWWLLSFGLADHSIPAWVDGDLIVSGSPPPTDEADIHDSTFSIPIRRDLCELKPGSESAIRIRLDDGPMGPHLLNESQALVDSDGTLHAQFTVRLSRPIHSVLLSPSIDLSDTASQTSSAMERATTATTISSRSEPSRSPISPISSNVRKKWEKDPSKPVYATLRRGGR